MLEDACGEETQSQDCSEDIIHEAGTLQTCAGLESDTEAATHSLWKSFQDEASEPFVVGCINQLKVSL